jgi:hypothetical protein
VSSERDLANSPTSPDGRAGEIGRFVDVEALPFLKVTRVLAESASGSSVIDAVAPSR